MVSITDIVDGPASSEEINISVSNTVISSTEVQEVQVKRNNNICENGEAVAANLNPTTTTSSNGENNSNNETEKAGCKIHPLLSPNTRPAPFSGLAHIPQIPDIIPVEDESLLPIGINEERVVNNVPTSFICYGGTLDDIQDKDCIIFLIPGNPGIIEYYRSFMANLHYGIGIVQPAYRTMTIGISHAGHQIIGCSECPPLHGNQDLYSLNGQVVHKLAFFREYLKNKKVILFSHSIGSYISLEIFKRDPEIAETIVHSFLLFPCIQQIRFTANGKFFWACKPYYNWLIKPLLYPLFFLPQFMQRGLLKFYFYFRMKSISDSAIKASLQLFNKDVAFRALEMARDELDDVIELDEETLKAHVNKLFVYFGAADEWCPILLCNETIEKIRDLDYCVCTNDIGHAFVLESSELMADLMIPKVAEVLNRIELQRSDEDTSDEDSNEEFEEFAD